MFMIGLTLLWTAWMLSQPPFSTSSMTVEIVNRSQWGARPPTEREYIPMPVPYLILHHTAGKRCYTHENCSAVMRGIQNFHMDDRKWGDIGYTFCVGEDGRVYEGRGWNVWGAHNIGYNNKSIGLCILGNFVNESPNRAALDAAKGFLDYSVEMNKLTHDYILYGHRQAKNGTVCPGDALFNDIREWPHWKQGNHFPPNSKGCEDHAYPLYSMACREIQETTTMGFDNSSELVHISAAQRLYKALGVVFPLVVIVVTSYLSNMDKINQSESSDMAVEIVSRSKWGARSVSEHDNMSMPVPYVILHHTAGRRCSTYESCCAEMRSIQNFHMDGRKWWDIGYTFCVGEDGRVYEGRGWNVQGAHSIGYNAKSIGLCILGNFVNDSPNKAALDAAQKFLEYCVENNKLTPDYTLYGHRQSKNGTVCPGDALFKHIQTWPHWKPGDHFPPSK
ncbi:peptidoglycan recognition protein 3-like [Ptychodera flava]|uniref:peptidoglycan recognition protein 3-like n=1 Tax=Ptychodera flava TaxID=63121 RepID=UPI00396A0B04